jgi:hypothetical protein
MGQEGLVKTRLTLISLSLLAGCVSAPEPAPAPVRAPLPYATPKPAVPLATPTANWEDLSPTPGDWVYRADGRGAVAMFGVSGADANFLIRCDKAKSRIYLSRPGAFPSGETGRMTIRATTGLQTYAVANTGGTPAYISAELMTGDPHLDAMAFSRGKFLVTVKGAEDLVIPSWPELARVVEDCR